jgi:hypothetical protein
MVSRLSSSSNWSTRQSHAGLARGRHRPSHPGDSFHRGFADAVIALAGRSFTDAIGASPLSENEPDIRNATNAILREMSVEIGFAGVERAYAVVEETALGDSRS